MHLTIISSFLFFTGLVGLTTWFLTRKDDHSSTKGFFLGGRSLTFPLIAGSLLLTNLSTEQMIGLNGAAFRDGLSVMAWEVIAVVALVLMALFFLPKFLKSGVTTVPEYLGIRFNTRTRLLTNLIFLIAYAVILLPIILYTGAKGLTGMLDLASLTGIENETTLLWVTIWTVGLIGSVYALFGGLRTVAVSDTLNGMGLLVGGLLITYFGLNAVSDGAGIFEGWNILKAASPEKFNSVGGENQSVPFSTLFTGVFLLNLFYWCTNQQIIQRTLGAKDLAEGQKGVLLTGALKLLGPLYLVLPGMISFYLFKDMGIAPDQAYGMLVHKVLPPYLNGFFAAVMIGAILSSFNSALNSTCTLFSLGVYRNAINREAEGKTLVRASKYFGWIMAFITMSIAPLLAGQDSIFGYLQKMNGIYFIPLFAVILVGMLSKRIPAVAANWALPLGILVIAFGYFVPLGEGMYLTNYIHDFHFLGMVFLGLILFMILIGIMNPTEEFEQVDAKLVDLTPWRYAPHASAVLIFLVFTIYYSFSDFTLVVPFAYKPILAALILTLLVLRLRRKKAVMAN
jgi:SSS family solute:Na+ symporter